MDGANSSERTMPYRLSEAAAACSLTKSTVRRAIKTGKVSATKDAHGQWHIEPAELHRVYPPRTEASTDERQSQRLSKALCFQHDADGSTTRVPRRHDADLAWVVPTPVSSQEPHPGTGRGGAPTKGRHGWQFRQFGCRIFMRFVTEITESASHGTPFTADS